MSVREPPAHRRPYSNVLEVIGWTPLICLNHVVDGAAAAVYGKAEFMNPGGSVKDRIGIAMIEAAEKAGVLKPGGVVVEGTAGNTGVGLAIAAAIKGYRCIFTMPDKFSQEKIRLMKAFGAEVIITPTAVAPDDPENYLNVARQIAEETPNAIMADQFYNQANVEAHYRTTGPEIWAQTEGRVTHFVCSAGTGGTTTGVARFLKEQNSSIKVIVADPLGSVFAHYFRTGELGPHSPYKVEGVGNDRLPGTLDFGLIDEFRVVADRDALNMSRRLTREEALFVGGSSGLNVCVAVQVARELDDRDAMIVCVLPDTGERYLSKIYSDDWMRENRLLVGDGVTVNLVLQQKARQTPALISIEPGTTVREVLKLIEEHHVSQLPVMVNGDCVGSVSEAVLMSRLVESPDLIDAHVQDLMEPALPVVDSDSDFDSVTRQLIGGQPAVIIRREGAPAGIITRFDVVHFFIGTGS